MRRVSRHPQARWRSRLAAVKRRHFGTVPYFVLAWYERDDADTETGPHVGAWVQSAAHGFWIAAAIDFNSEVWPTLNDTQRAIVMRGLASQVTGKLTGLGITCRRVLTRRGGSPSPRFARCPRDPYL